MKLTYILLFVALFQIHANGFSQKKQLSLDVTNVTILEVFSEIEQLTGYKFLYDIDAINEKRQISLFAAKEPLKQVLGKVFKNTNISFVLVDDQIILKRNDNVSGQQSTKVSSQNAQQMVEGLVFDNDNVLLPGVSIIIKGTQRGTSTDFDGKFSISASEGDVLVFGYLGFGDQEVTVTSQTEYTVIMQPSSFELEGVTLVSDGYQKLSRERATGAFGKVDQKVLKPKIVQDVFAKLEGEVPGVLFDGGIARGAAAIQSGNEVIIRGLNTINGAKSPLIVIDGFPLEGNNQPGSGIINTFTVNPNDVESITVLKDAAAASIWGVRAANGVIVITTKKGKAGERISIEATASTSITGQTDVFGAGYASPADQVDFYREFYAEGRNNNFNPNNLFNGELRNASLPQLHPIIETILRQQTGNITEAEANAQFAELSKTDIRNDIQDLIRPQIWNQFNVSLSGGGEGYTFNSSILYNENQQELIGTNSNQINVNLGNTISLFKKLKFTSSINYSRAKINNGPSDIANVLNILNSESINSRIVGDNGEYLAMRNGGLAVNQGASDLAVANGFLYPLTYNVKQELENADNKTTINDIRLQGKLDYQITPELSASASYQYEQQQNERRELRSTETFFTRNEIATYAQLDPIDLSPISFPFPDGAILDNDITQSKSFTARAQLNYDASYNEGDHRLTGLAGYEVRRTILEGSTRRLYGYDDESLTSVSVDFITRFSSPLFNPQGGGIRIFDRNTFFGPTFVENRFISTYANLAYTYQNTYTISGSARLDDTNLFGASNKFRNVPLYSFGLKWNVRNDFFENNEKVNELGFRATYGLNGNVSRDTSPFLVATVFREFDRFNNPAAFVNNAPNPLLQLERTRSLNLGLDFSFFEGRRLFGSLEYYNNLSRDLLANRNLNPTSGLRSLLLNSGKLSNNGVEATLGVLVVNGTNFNYTTRGVFSLNKNKLIQADARFNDFRSFTEGSAFIKGDALQTIYSARYAGLDRNGNPQYFNAANEIVDYTTDLDIIDLEKSGSLVPEYFGSWINELSYKNLSLRILTTFKGGHVFRPVAGAGFFNPSALVSGGLNVHKDAALRFRQRGDENRTDIPRIPLINEVATPGFTNYVNADRNLLDATHVRLQQIGLSYTLPEQVSGNIGFQGLSFGLQAENIAVWTVNKKGIDPDYPFFPVQPSISLQVNMNF